MAGASCYDGDILLRREQPGTTGVYPDTTENLRVLRDSLQGPLCYDGEHPATTGTLCYDGEHPATTGASCYDGGIQHQLRREHPGTTGTSCYDRESTCSTRFLQGVYAYDGDAQLRSARLRREHPAGALTARPLALVV